MGRKSTSFLQGRLLMAGADQDLVVTCVENISRPEERRFTTSLSSFAQRLDEDSWKGPLIIFVGIGQDRRVEVSSVSTVQEATHGSH
jgi:siroheme synthase